MTTMLAIESSCDETAAAVVRGREVVSSVVATQLDLHRAFGGVVPEVASRRHLEVIDEVIAEALSRAQIERPDAVAVTQGPGLIGALLVGVAAAEARALAWDVPLIAVDHLLGHVASALIATPELEPPFSCMLVSGGHSLLLDVDESFTVRMLGTSRDDAAGEAFDKGARLLGLPMPGGPSIQQAAVGGTAANVPITPAMVHQRTLDTSFAGIKTALAVHLREHPDTNVADAAASLQNAIVETLLASTRKLFDGVVADAPRRSTLAVVGGVAANAMLRGELDALCARNGVTLVTVPLQYCGDNAAMIGVAAGLQNVEKLPRLRGIDAFASSPVFRSGVLAPTATV
jgi:N6-L-threonylcarbamoyladenine synthase